jgi:hypothetical protein
MTMLSAAPALPETGGGAQVRIKLRNSAAAPANPIAGAVSMAAKWGVVTSVRRSVEHNRAVGGAPNSWHLQGRAIDIARRPGVRHGEIDAALRRAGYVLVESLDEGDHSHFAFGGVGAVPRPAAPRTVRMASAEAASVPTCSVKDVTSLGRRRPGADDVCLSGPEPQGKYRPIESAP